MAEYARHPEGACAGCFTTFPIEELDIMNHCAPCSELRAARLKEIEERRKAEAAKGKVAARGNTPEVTGQDTDNG